MRISQYLFSTLKEIPKNCEIISHQLMLRSGLIRQISSGLYIWLPMGLRVLKKIENIIREEMNNHGAIEISMPIVQPADLWKKSGRWIKYGMELLRFKNRNNKDFILSPTHEEMVSKLICKTITSYKQFPLNIYQIHTKYRDEARPRYGIIRSREFIMKDGYSFHVTQESLQKTYNHMYQAYQKIFNRIGLNFCTVQANPGKIGGVLSHEFQAYSNNGEDKIILPMQYNKNYNTAYNKHTEFVPIKIQLKSPTEPMRVMNKLYFTSIEELAKNFNISISKIVKIKIIRIHEQKSIIKKNNFNLLGLAIRADHQLDCEKIKKTIKITQPISFVNAKEICMITGNKPNLLGSIDMDIPYIIDYHVALMNDFVAGSSIYDKYFFGVNWNRDLPLPQIADLHKSLNNTCVSQQNKCTIYNSIEIGHIFQLGAKYSKIIQNHVKNNQQNSTTIKMGCYGIGISRIVAVVIEQNHDKNGIIWPDIIAPFKLAIVPINMHHIIHLKNTAEKIYKELLYTIGSDILFDDRNMSPGAMFYDIDLIGIPHILIISEHNLNNQEIEYKHRKSNTIKKIKLNILSTFLKDTLIL